MERNKCPSISSLTFINFFYSIAKELFLPYEQFPWFKDKTINDITKVESFGEGHFYWENLDVDLSLDMIEHPERFPLQAHT